MTHRAIEDSGKKVSVQSPSPSLVSVLEEYDDYLNNLTETIARLDNALTPILHYDDFMEEVVSPGPDSPNVTPALDSFLLKNMSLRNLNNKLMHILDRIAL